MAKNPEFGRRARIALAKLDQAPTMEEIAERVGGLLGRKPLTGQAVGAWFRVGQEPADLDTITALASVLQCDARWLAFGDEPTISSPGRRIEAFNKTVQAHRDAKRKATERSASKRAAGVRPTTPIPPDKPRR